MRVLVLAIAGCAAAPPAPVEPEPEVGTIQTDEVLDQGRFEYVDGRLSEQFSIRRHPEGWRIAIELTSSALRANGELVTDSSFRPRHGTTTSQPTGQTRPVISELRLEQDGLLASDTYSSETDHHVVRAKERADWYIGGLATAFLAPICQYTGKGKRPIVFPDTVVELSAATPLEVDGLERRVAIRRVEYPNKRSFVVACERGKLVGERSPEAVVIRAGDVAVGRALQKLAL